MKPLVSVIIVNWNGRVHLPECLDSLAGQSWRHFEVIFVDNGSRDDSVDFVRLHYPWVKLVCLPDNIGFASGNNRGFGKAAGDYLVTLNNDTRVEPDWLEKLVRVADDYPEAGMVGCRICTFADPDVIDSLGMGICRDGMSRGLYRRHRWSTLSFPEVIDILFPSACAALYRREMIEQIGFFDDDFFAYAEDSDLGLRGRLAGWQAVLATSAVVYHKYSQTGGSLSPLKVYLVERNHFWVAFKCFSGLHLLALPLLTLARYLVQAGMVLKSGGTGKEFRRADTRGSLLAASLRGMFDSVIGLPKMYRKRRLVKATRRLSGRAFSTLLRRYHITFRELLDYNQAK